MITVTNNNLIKGIITTPKKIIIKSNSNKKNNKSLSKQRSARQSKAKHIYVHKDQMPQTDEEAEVYKLEHKAYGLP